MSRFLLLLVTFLPVRAWQGVITSTVPPVPVTQPQQPESQPQGQQTQKEKEKEPGRIEGTVVLATTGAPVRKAQVALFSTEQRTPIAAATDQGGKFVFEKVAPGDYNFNVTHPRYTAADDKGGFPGFDIRRISLSEGQVVKGVVFKMLPGAVVTGRVIDEYGDPQPRANVSLQRYRFVQNKKQLMPASSDMSDDRGEYRVFNVPPGRYFLSVQYEDRQWGRSARQAQGEEVSYPTVYYPGVLEVETAMAVDLRPGEERQGMDLRLVRDRSVRVKGRVMEGDRPARDAGVMLMQKGSMDYRAMKQQGVDATGEFEFSGVRPETYLLSATKMEGPQDRMQGRMEVLVGSSNVEGVVVTLTAGVDIPGQVVVEGDNAASVSFAEKPMRIILESSERSFFGRGGMPSMVKPDGSFVVQSVAVGTYRVRLWQVPDGGYLAGALFGDQDVTGQDFEIGPATQAPLKLRLRMAAATVAGVAKNDKGQAAPNVQIVVAPEQSRRSQQELFRIQATDQYGSFSVKNLPPGEYRVWALSKVEAGQHTDPDFLATIEKHGEKVEADEKGSYTLDLKVLEVPDGH